MKQATVCCVRDAGDHYEILLSTGENTEPVIVTIGQLANVVQDGAAILGKIIRGHGSNTSATAKNTNGQAGKYIEKVYRHSTVNTRSSANGKVTASL